MLIKYLGDDWNIKQGNFSEISGRVQGFDRQWNKLQRR